MTERETAATIAGIKALKRGLIEGVHLDRVDQEEGAAPGMSSNRARSVLRIMMGRYGVPGMQTVRAQRKNPDIIKPYLTIFEKETLGIPLSPDEEAFAYPQKLVPPPETLSPDARALVEIAISAIEKVVQDLRDLITQQDELNF